jgi:acyl-CoA hydrolase
VGEMVSLKASINHVGNSSMLVGIHVISENFLTGSVKHTNTFYFTMVAKDSHGKPTGVPSLILETKDEVRRFLEAIQRKGLRKMFKENLDNAKTLLTVEQ